MSGLTEANPGEISNEFNSNFSTIGSTLAVRFNLNNSVDYQRYLTSTDKLFLLHPTNANKVFSLMNQLNKSKATGLEIYARLIRECADLISVYICDVFDQSISQGKFPEDWKSARLTPLFKQADRDDGNVRSRLSQLWSRYSRE